jgi:hypothetical protein
MSVYDALDYRDYRMFQSHAYHRFQSHRRSPSSLYKFDIVVKIPEVRIEIPCIAGQTVLLKRCLKNKTS